MDYVLELQQDRALTINGAMLEAALQICNVASSLQQAAWHDCVKSRRLALVRNTSSW